MQNWVLSTFLWKHKPCSNHNGDLYSTLIAVSTVCWAAASYPVKITATKDNVSRNNIDSKQEQHWWHEHKLCMFFPPVSFLQHMYSSVISILDCGQDSCCCCLADPVMNVLILPAHLLRRLLFAWRYGDKCIDTAGTLVKTTAVCLQIQWRRIDTAGTLVKTTAVCL